MIKSKAATYINKGLNFSYLSLGQSDELHQAALKILSSTGIRVENAEAAERLQGAGVKVDKDGQVWKAKIQEKAVMGAIDSTPKNQTWYGQTPECDFTPGPGKIGFSPSGVNINVIDPSSRKVRTATLKDSENLYKIVDQLPLVTSLSEAMVIGDLNQDISPVAAVYSMLRFCRKFILCYPGSIDNCKTILDMAAVAVGGRDNLLARPFISLACCPLSPLTLDYDTCEVSMFAARQGVYVQAMNGALAGATSPLSSEGAIAQTLAELWAILILHQVTQPGTRSQLSTFTNAMSMRTSLACLGGPEAGYICTAVAEIVQRFGIYGHFCAGTTDSKCPDAQAGYEFATNVLLMALSGSSMIFGLGGMEAGLTFDYAKLLMDHECAANMAAILKGLNINEEELALDLIDKVGPKGGFLSERHTLKRARTLSDNQFFDRGSRGTWENQGSLSAADRAYARVLELIEEDRPSHLSPDKLADMEVIFTDCVKKAG